MRKEQRKGEEDRKIEGGNRRENMPKDIEKLKRKEKNGEKQRRGRQEKEMQGYEGKYCYGKEQKGMKRTNERRRK